MESWVCGPYIVSHSLEETALLLKHQHSSVGMAPLGSEKYL